MSGVSLCGNYIENVKPYTQKEKVRNKFSRIVRFGQPAKNVTSHCAAVRYGEPLSSISREVSFRRSLRLIGAVKEEYVIIVKNEGQRAMRDGDFACSRSAVTPLLTTPGRASSTSCGLGTKNRP